MLPNEQTNELTNKHDGSQYFLAEVKTSTVMVGWMDRQKYVNLYILP